MCTILTISVSTSEQVDHGQSMEVQKQQLISRAKVDGFLEKDILIYEDPGVSGIKFSNRPGILKLIERLQSKSNDIKKVYCFKLDRISRSTHEIHWFINLCFEQGIHFVAIRDAIDTSDEIIARILISIFGLVSELEIENIKVRINAVIKKRKNEGKIHGGRYDNLGYNRVKDKHGNSHFIINEKESKIVKTIFDLYGQGLGGPTIANELNKEGYLTSSVGKYNPSSIYRILNNPIYIGKIRAVNDHKANQEKLIDGQHRPIITMEQWEKIQSKLNENKIIKKEFEYDLFSAKIICNQCGSRMYGQFNKGNKTRYKYYSCSN